MLREIPTYTLFRAERFTMRRAVGLFGALDGAELVLALPEPLCDDGLGRDDGFLNATLSGEREGVDDGGGVGCCCWVRGFGAMNPFWRVTGVFGWREGRFDLDDGVSGGAGLEGRLSWDKSIGVSGISDETFRGTKTTKSTNREVT